MQYIGPQQQAIVESIARYKLINGCAGSHKTDTLIKCAVNDLRINRRPILFLTMVGSVTDEIRSRLSAALDVDITRHGESNHYMGVYDDEIPICVSNYDAWVHQMLFEYSQAKVPGGDFNAKINLLLDVSSTRNIVAKMKSRNKVGLLLLDEAQDLRAPRMQILVNSARGSPTMDFYIAGDFLQTIFEADEVAHHPMDTFKALSHTYFDMNVCRRCPRAHVALNNLLLKEAQLEIGTPPMESNNDNLADKPLIFTHLPTKDDANPNGNARINAEDITQMLEILMDKDPSIIPGDIAVIMAKTNGNALFAQLQSTMNDMFVKRGLPPGLVYHMKTDADGTKSALDWKRAIGKAILVSIHGDKGRGHKVVVFAGLTQGSLPAEYQSRLLSSSLLNVATTRSTKYLLIGIGHKMPSSMLHEQMDHYYRDYAYIDWARWKHEKDPDTVPPGEMGYVGEISSIPEPYRSIIARKSFNSKLWPQPFKMQEKKLYGYPHQVQVRDNIAKDFANASELMPGDWHTPEIDTFGTEQEVKLELPEEYMMLGIMSEILIHRLHQRDEIMEYLKKYANAANVVYTDDEQYLSFMYDLRNKEAFEWDEYTRSKGRFFQSKEKSIVELIAKLTARLHDKKRVVHTIFSSAEFDEDRRAFMSVVPNYELSSRCCWNMAVYWNQLTQNIYQPSINLLINRFSGDISVLHDNIGTYALRITGHKLVFEYPAMTCARFDLVEMVKMKIARYNVTDADYCKKCKTTLKTCMCKIEDHTVSISGRCDIYDGDMREIVEIKTSTFDECSPQWMIQALMYAAMFHFLGARTKKFSVVNILRGVIWTWKFPRDFSMPALVDTIAKRYKWHALEVAAMQKHVKDHMEIVAKMPHVESSSDDDSDSEAVEEVW